MYAYTYIFSASKIIPSLHDQIKYANMLFSKEKKWTFPFRHILIKS